MNLPELVRISNELRLYLIESNGEITDEMTKFMSIVEENLPAKVDSYKFVIDDMELECEKYKERSDELLRVSKGYKTFVEKLKEMLKYACVSMNKTELIGNDYKWKLQNSRAAVVILNEEEIPSKYKSVIQTFKVNKEQILDDLKSGIDVPGCRVEISTHVRAYPLGARR